MPTTRVTRLRELQREDRQALDAVLDECLVAHVAVLGDDGAPVVLPTGVARRGDLVVVHGSTRSGWMRMAAEGRPSSVAVTALDGVIVARSTFESSIRYRSAVVHGRWHRLAGDEEASALDGLVDKLIPGRRGEVRPPTLSERQRTMVLAMPIETWSLKVSDGWADDGPDDRAGDAWAGVVPLSLVGGAPLRDPGLRPGIPVPQSVVNLSQRGR